MMKRILIADDSSTARLFIRRCMEIVLNEEMEFVEASNGKPVMDGQTFLMRVVASPRLTGTPVVVITSVNNAARKEELIKLGAVAVLGKPLTPQALSGALEGIFSDSIKNNP
jgi:two-component system chemotaxis response regulator CheY